MHAEIGDRLEFVARQHTEVERAGQHAAQQIGFCPRRRFLAGHETEDRAHAELRRLRAALAATVARGHRIVDPRRLPIQLQFDQVP